MPSLKCKGCGRMTSTSVSDFLDTWPDAKECYLAADPKTETWVKGCAYEKVKIDKNLADRWLGKPASYIQKRPQNISKILKEDDYNEDTI